MLTKKEEEVIKRCARKFNVSSVLLFGSSVSQKDAADIDLAVKGIRTGLFFKFYGELFKALDKPVDLIDLNDADNYFMNRILEGCRVIYEA